MRLIYKPSGKEVQVGQIVMLHGVPWMIDYFKPPHKPSSEGKVTVTRVDALGKLQTAEYYVSVISAEWVDREDRQPAPVTRNKHLHLRMYQTDQYPDFETAFLQEAVYSFPLPDSDNTPASFDDRQIKAAVMAIETALTMKDAAFSVHIRICEWDKLEALAKRVYTKGHVSYIEEML